MHIIRWISFIGKTSMFLDGGLYLSVHQSFKSIIFVEYYIKITGLEVSYFLCLL